MEKLKQTGGGWIPVFIIVTCCWQTSLGWWSGSEVKECLLISTKSMFLWWSNVRWRLVQHQRQNKPRINLKVLLCPSLIRWQSCKVVKCQTSIELKVFDNGKSEIEVSGKMFVAGCHFFEAEGKTTLFRPDLHKGRVFCFELYKCDLMHWCWDDSCYPKKIVTSVLKNGIYQISFSVWIPSQSMKSMLMTFCRHNSHKF